MNNCVRALFCVISSQYAYCSIPFDFVFCSFICDCRVWTVSNLLILMQEKIEKYIEMKLYFPL